MDLAELEQQRLALEASLDKLRQSLKHWQTWEAEYEGLKEELSIATAELTADDLTKLAKEYSGELVTEKEVIELAGLDKGNVRTARHIIGLIERRQDYVKKSIETVQRQYFDAEAKSEELAFAVAPHGGDGEGGLPLTEIHEELDEDGNVISSALSRPEESTSQMIESLRKAGLKDADLQHEAALKPAITNATPPMVPTPMAAIPDKRPLSESPVLTADAGHDHQEPERPSIRKKSVSFTADTKEPVKQARPESEEGHKRVSFNEKVAVMPAAPPPDPRSVSFSPKVEEIPPQPLGPPSPAVEPVESSDVQTSLRERFKPGERVAELNDDDEIEKIHIVLPENESPEDAKTRREMLEYHLNEVGNVVAQIDLEEGKARAGADDYEEDDDDDNLSFHTSSEYLDDDDTPYTTGVSDSDEEEDEFGRSLKPQMSEEYVKRMEELSERLIGNLGPEPEDGDVEEVDPEIDLQDVKRLVIREKRNSTSSASSETSDKKTSAGKKRVSFAETLDVAEPGSPPLKAQKHVQGENVGPVADTIAERKPVAPSISSRPTDPKPAKLSRFKAARASAAEDAVMEDNEFQASNLDTPTGPANATLASTLLERTPDSRSVPLAPGEDEHDEVVQRRQLADVYYTQRNKMIKEQGGFGLGEGEEQVVEDLGEGKTRKVSRFRAARLRGVNAEGAGEME